MDKFDNKQPRRGILHSIGIDSKGRLSLMMSTPAKSIADIVTEQILEDAATRLKHGPGESNAT